MIFREPMLATASTGASGRRPIKVESLAGTHAFDTKIDGIRAYCHWQHGSMRLVNRNGVDITKRYPEITDVQLPHDVWLDGEIVAASGSFEDVLTRDKQEKAASIARLSKSMPCRFVAFDVPEFAALSWWDRRKILDELGRTWRTSKVENTFSTTPCSLDIGFVREVARLGLEGVVAKRLTSRYQFGRRSPDWVKFKNVHRITCLVSGYSPGHGSRAHFGTMNLALIDPAGQVVPVGPVGSGFSERQTHVLKQKLDAGEMLVVEIEALNVTSGGALRHAVFRGVRTDVDPLACTTDQLDTLPRS